MKAILTDVTKCTGCENCVTACVEENKLGKTFPWKWISDDGLSSERFTSIIRRPGGHNIRKQCRHCIDPACVSSCPVGALQKTAEGAVTYDSDKCLGCRYCMMACPFGIPRYSWEDAVPYVRKCTMCYHRIAEGKIPACVEACPEQATIYGDRDELIAEAKSRIQSAPDKYIDKVFGEHEVGGTSVLYIAGIDLDFLNWRSGIDDRPYPSMTKFAMEAVPPVFFGMGAVMYGIYKITERRAKVQNETENKNINPDTRSAEDEIENS